MLIFDGGIGSPINNAIENLGFGYKRTKSEQHFLIGRVY